MKNEFELNPNTGMDSTKNVPKGEDKYEGPYRPLREGEEVDPDDLSQNTITREPTVPVRKYGE